MRLLIAEDDCVSSRILQGMLQNWGHEVVVTSDGRQAWEQLQVPDAPSMVILDWVMPHLDGIEVCLRLRQLKRDIRPYIILLTGKDQKRDMIQGLGAGADDYVTKPFDPDELRVRIDAGRRILDLQIESLMAMEALRRQASHDYLTGLPNRATIMGLLDKEFARTARNGSHVGVVMADIDNFKDVNDTFGHPTGDVLLTEVAKRLATEMRSYEYVGRYGGEEFLIILADCDTQAAMGAAERLRYAVAAKTFDVGNLRLPITLSFGVASTSQLRSPTQGLLVQIADAAMYRAKRAGRNRVECAADLSDYNLAGASLYLPE
ncbi:MAG: diguanylate cyclase [Phycisphaerae bacterium]